MKIGYARVSTEEQSLDLQISALVAAGCDEIMRDHGISGSCFDRPGLQAALGIAQAGDRIVVWRLDRLGRSLSDLVDTVNTLCSRGVEFVSLTESIDTSSSTGRLMFHMIAALAEFERSLISERTRAGMAAARERGVKLGRPRKTIGKIAGRTEAEGNDVRCLGEFMKRDLLPGRKNPGQWSFWDATAPDALPLPDVIQRTQRRIDLRRTGRRSRYIDISPQILSWLPAELSTPI